jgi:hypothetical protein
MEVYVIEQKIHGWVPVDASISTRLNQERRLKERWEIKFPDDKFRICLYKRAEKQPKYLNYSVEEIKKDQGI